MSLAVLRSSSTFESMPTISTKSNKRPWLPESKPFERSPIIGEAKLDNSWYNSSEWRKLSKEKRTTDPLCEVCKRDGIVTVGNVADHIKPSRIYPELRTDWNNLQTMCNRHHNIKSQIEKKIKNKKDFIKLLSRGRGAKLFVLKS